MPAYTFTGVVLPERAQISLKTTLAFTHVGSQVEGTASVSIINNDMVVLIDSPSPWDVFDLRNVVRSIVQNELAMVGYLRGYAYNLEVIRVVSRETGDDYVFGIDVPCLGHRFEGDIGPPLARMRMQVAGVNGVHIQRCLGDLASAIRSADDTAFYCYRALESLCHHHASMHNLTDLNRAAQWAAFRAAAAADEQPIRDIQAAANPLRHGHAAAATAADRVKLFTTTWKIVDAYLGVLGVHPT